MGITEAQIISLNKSRKRAVYWWQGEDGNWNPTGPLPADPASINYYFLKGFKAQPPHEAQASNEAEPVEAKTRFMISCPICGFETQSAFGLQTHLRKHIKKSEKKEGKT